MPSLLPVPRVFLLGGASLLLAASAHADVKLPAVFGDHMVLQQETTLPVWGWADPGEKVTVTFGARKAEATAAADGKWRVDLAPAPAGTPPGTLVVAGKNTLTLNDVLTGDVWLCSGQSNMEFAASRPDVAEAKDSSIRLFRVAHALAIAPRADVVGKWEVCSPATLAGFSAVGYNFGKELRADLNRPIGLIESSVGGTGAQEWTDLPALQGDPLLRHYADTVAKIVASYPGGDAEYIAKTASSSEADKAWNARIAADPEYSAALKAWTDEANKARAAGLPVPRGPQPPAGKPAPLVGHRGDPTLLFNGMIAPLIPYALKGVIWYQGENNAKGGGVAVEYRTLFGAMITSWRKQWNEGDLPFLFVQLANYKGGSGDDWAHLRESQLKTLALPKTGMAVTIDIGTGGNIHPPDKVDVGKRLALAARHIAYGEKVVFTGPIYDSMKAERNAVRLSFKPDSLGGGLVIGAASFVDPKAEPVSKTDLQGFMIAGPDKTWVEAQAKIEGNTVVVSSAQTPNPAAVRYAWAQDPRCNLYNKEGLPASPFRTDAWEEPPAPAK